ncbi:MAG: NUDIX domain-containing protein [Acidimicrobiales bacterium]
MSEGTSTGSDPAAAAAAELVELVDDGGAVVGLVTRAEMRAGGGRHRCSYVFLLTPDRHLVVHQRAQWKDVFPGAWDVAFGGVCGVGESWFDSARRELGEEAGVDGVELVDLGAVTYDTPGVAILGRVFVAVTDRTPTTSDEVVRLERVPLDRLERWRHGRVTCPDSVAAALPVLLDWAAGQH